VLGFRLESFSKAATSMLLGESSPALAEGRAFGVQALSGTGALRFADFIVTREKKSISSVTLYID
jgi:aspartate aminotransferase